VPAEANAVPTPKAGRREWVGLAVIALPCLLYAMDLTVLNLAVPHLSADLQPSSAQLLWIVDIYGFLAAGLLVTMGTLGDRIGRRRLLLGGAAAFGVASVLAASATRSPPGRSLRRQGGRRQGPRSRRRGASRVMMTCATPVAPALPAVDDPAANPLRPGTRPECLLGAGGDPAAGGQALVGAIGLFGLAGLLGDADKTMPAVWIVWLVGLLLTHDASVLALAAVRHLCARGWAVRIRAP
jgi:hypothetical protein